MADYCAEILDDQSDLREWDSFVRLSPQGSVFCQSWWLRAVCSDAFSVLVLRRKGRIVAGMPMARSQRYCFRLSAMPPYTQTLGVLLEPSALNAKYETRLSKEMDMLKALVAAIPRFDHIVIRCNYSFTNWLPFYWAGYSQTTRYTYVIEDLTDPARLRNAMSARTRNKIQRAERDGISVSESDDVGILVDLVDKTLKRNGMGGAGDPAVIRRIYDASVSQNSGLLLVASDRQGRTHSALFAVYDESCMYFLMQGRDPALPGSQAAKLAQWRSIEYAAKVARRYDFEGSMVESIENIFRCFGAVQKPFFEITKTRPLVRVLGAAIRSGKRILATRSRDANGIA